MGNNRNQQRTKKRKFASNQYSQKKKDTTRSASNRKQLPSSQCSEQRVNNSEHGFLLFDTRYLNTIVSLLACPVCYNLGTVYLTHQEEKQNGLASCLTLCCSECAFRSGEMYTCKRTNNAFEINRRCVYAFREIGCGYSDAVKFCYLMDLPHPPRQKSWDSHVKAIGNVVERLAEETMNSAAHEVRIAEGKECAVSVDGSWQRRGFSSLIGIVSAISVRTGKILDVEVLSKECKTCKKHEKDDKESPEYTAWKTDHSPICAKNFSGSSTNMEPVGAGRIFLRSEHLRGLQFTRYLGDGDSKSYKSVCKLDPYSGKSIEKLECVGHFQKRLGSSLRILVKEKRLGGKGKLTKGLINKMQNYFGVALRANTHSVESMAEAIWASFYHLASSDKKPLHDKCPKGNDSWCSYQVAKINKKHYKHKYELPEPIILEVEKVYRRLTEKSLLERCLHGKTQNSNESFNGMVWQRCPKETYLGLKNVNVGVKDAVCHYNCGSKIELEIYRRLFIEPGKNMLQGVKKCETQKKKQSQKQTTPENKNRRRYLRGRRRVREDMEIEKEGRTYNSGAF